MHWMAAVTGSAALSPYFLSGATCCYVSVYARALGTIAKTAAAEFSY